MKSIRASLSDTGGDSAAGVRSRWGGLPLQMILFFIIPLTLVLSAGAFASVTWHESAMRDLVRARDERAIQLAADGLATRVAQRRLGLTLIQQHLTTGETLEELATAEPDLVEMFDVGLFQRDAQGSVVAGWPTRLACTSDAPEVISLEKADVRPVLVGCVSLQKLGMPEIAAQLHTSHVVAIFLVDDQGRLRFRTDGKDSGSAILDRLPVAEVLAGKRGSTEIEQGKMTVAYSPVAEIGWGLMMTEPWHEIASSRLRLSQFAPLTILPVTLLSVLVLGFATVQVVRPLQKLRRQAASLPDGDLGQLEVPVGGIQEITDLQKTLVEMARRLRDAQATLRDYIGAITRAQEDERFRLARDLHDDTIQALIALNQRVQMAQRTLKRDPQQVEGRLQELRAMADQMIGDVRGMVQAMRPTYLADLGLVAAVRALVQNVEAEGLEAAFELQGSPYRLDDELELGFYRVAQEAISNVVKHAHARHLNVRLAFEPEQVSLSVQDDGCGFRVPHTLLSLINAGNYGLVGISERVQLVNGTLNITSAEGTGTTVVVCVPLH